MSRQRRRAIERRYEKIRAKDESGLTAEELLDDIMELESLTHEINSMMLQTLERRPHLTPFERRLFHYLTKAAHR
ncbi:MAG TPA: hypothetical protein VGC03_00925 [Acidimicrobiia bacterium]|jgi:hypothetical protein